MMVPDLNSRTGKLSDDQPVSYPYFGRPLSYLYSIYNIKDEQ
jgi:hypothetical protein